jgi:hypothetical protein
MRSDIEYLDEDDQTDGVQRKQGKDPDRAST